MRGRVVGQRKEAGVKLQDVHDVCFPYTGLVAL